MKKLILIFAFVAITFAAKSQNEAFLVSYDSLGHIVGKTVFKIDSVKVLFDQKFEGLKNGGLYFDFYVERKRINKKGKLKRIKK